MKTSKIAVIAILAALSIGTNYAMISLFNVKLMDFIVFVGGFCFGPFVGVLIGIISWAVYGTLNPMGFVLPIWVSTMLSEAIYGVAGGLVRKAVTSHEVGESGNYSIGTYIFFGTVGMFLTFTYDVITNIVFGYFAYFGHVTWWTIVASIVSGFVPFGLVHVASNAAFFGIGCVPTIRAIMNVVGGEKSDFPKE